MNMNYYQLIYPRGFVEIYRVDMSYHFLRRRAPIKYRIARPLGVRITYSNNTVFSPIQSSRRLHPLMHRRNPARQILPPLPRDQEPRVFNHIPELCLTGELGNALHQILVAISIPGNQLANERDRTKAPALVHGVKHWIVHFAELEARKDAAGLEHAVRFAQGGFFRREVANAEGDGVEVYACIWDHGEVLGVGFEEGEARGARVGRREGPLFSFREHVWVDVCDGDAGVRVIVDGGGVVEHPEGDVASTARDVEDVPAW